MAVDPKRVKAIFMTVSEVAADCWYEIEQGTVRLHAGDELETAGLYLGPGDTFGECGLAYFAHCASQCLASTFTDATGRRNGAFGFGKLGYPPRNRRFSPVFRRVSPQATAGRLAYLHKAHLSGSRDAPGKTPASFLRSFATKLSTAW